MIKLVRALAIVLLAVFITALFFTLFPLLMLIITIVVMLAFVWCAVRGVIELIKE